MKKRITNPFITHGYISPDYFCNRQSESERLLKAISSRRNVTMISLRRMGKTGLLKHVKYLLEQEKKPATVIYVDLMPTMNSNEMLNTLSSSLLRTRENEKNFIEKIMSTLSTLRPRLTYDSLTGQPSLELTIGASSEVQQGLQSLLRFISEIKQNIIFMLDEFQQISKYPEKNIEPILRSVTQAYPAIPFIFSGSSRHMLESMFLSVNKPFYQSAELMYIDRINEADYRNFITKMFLSGNKIIDNDSLSEIFRWTRLHTYYVQYVCSILYERQYKLINNDLIHMVFHQVLTAFEPLYISYRDLIPSHQFRLLQAIAIEDGIMQPTSGSFILKHNLTSASSVATSIKALAEKEMIVHDGTKWLVYDVFFSRWLEYNYKSL